MIIMERIVATLKHRIYPKTQQLYLQESNHPEHL